MKPQLKPCKCGKTPAIISPDVCENPVFYGRCKCGMATTWWSSADKAAKDWNDHLGADKPRCGRALTVLAHKKGELAYA